MVIMVAVFTVVVALACVGVWTTVIILRRKPNTAPVPFAATTAPILHGPPSTAAATDESAVSEDRSAQIDATRKAADARASDMQAEMAAAKKVPAVEPFVGDELSGYI